MATDDSGAEVDLSDAKARRLLTSNSLLDPQRADNPVANGATAVNAPIAVATNDERFVAGNANAERAVRAARRLEDAAEVSARNAPSASTRTTEVQNAVANRVAATINASAAVLITVGAIALALTLLFAFVLMRTNDARRQLVEYETVLRRDKGASAALTGNLIVFGTATVLFGVASLAALTQGIMVATAV